MDRLMGEKRTVLLIKIMLKIHLEFIYWAVYSRASTESMTTSGKL